MGAWPLPEDSHGLPLRANVRLLRHTLQFRAEYLVQFTVAPCDEMGIREGKISECRG